MVLGRALGTWPHITCSNDRFICGSPLNRMAWVQPVFSYIFLISSPKIGTSDVCSVLAALPCWVSPVFSRRGCRSCWGAGSRRCSVAKGSSSEPCTLELSSLTACSGIITCQTPLVLLQTPWACRELHGACEKWVTGGFTGQRGAGNGWNVLLRIN